MTLTELHAIIARKYYWLESMANALAALPLRDFEREKQASFVMIEFYNANAEWFRRYYVLVSTNSLQRKSGAKLIIGSKHHSPEDAILWAIGKMRDADARSKWIGSNNRIYEPTWGAKYVLPKLARLLNFPHHVKITTSFATAGASLEEVRSARNFYAHRNMDSLRQLKSLRAIPRKVPALPSELIFNIGTEGYNSCFLLWLDECERLISELCDF